MKNTNISQCVLVYCVDGYQKIATDTINDRFFAILANDVSIPV